MTLLVLKYCIDSDSEEEDLVNKEAPKQCKFPSKATNEKDYIECFQKYLLDGIYFKSHIMSAILRYTSNLIK